MNLLDALRALLKATNHHREELRCWTREDCPSCNIDLHEVVGEMVEIFCEDASGVCLTCLKNGTYGIEGELSNPARICQEHPISLPAVLWEELMLEES